MTVAGFDPAAKSSASAPSIRECLRALATPLQYLKGVGPKRAKQLESLGIRSVEDLLYHLPFRYEDRRAIKKICDAVLGEECSFVGRLAELQNRYVPRRRSQMLAGALQDDTGAIDLVWYRAPAFLVNGLAKGQIAARPWQNRVGLAPAIAHDPSRFRSDRGRGKCTNCAGSCRCMCIPTACL